MLESIADLCGHTSAETELSVPLSQFMIGRQVRGKRSARLRIHQGTNNCTGNRRDLGQIKCLAAASKVGGHHKNTAFSQRESSDVSLSVVPEHRTAASKVTNVLSRLGKRSGKNREMAAI